MGKFLQFLTELSACSTSIFSFMDDIFSKYQWIFTKLGICIDVVKICNVIASRPRWLSWMRRPTGDQEVTGSTPAEVGNILSWRLIMKYFLRSFSPFR